MKIPNQALVICLALCIAVAQVFLSISKVSASSGFPRAVQTVDQLNAIGQVGPLQATSVFTPSAKGLYRVSAYIVVTSRGSRGTIYVFAQWTDVTGLHQANLTSTCADEVGCANSGSAIASTVIGQPISVKITDTSDQLPPTYDVHVNVEQL